MPSQKEINDMVKACVSAVNEDRDSSIIVHPSGEWQRFELEEINLLGYDENSKPGDSDEGGGFLLCQIYDGDEKTIKNTIVSALKRENII